MKKKFLLSLSSLSICSTFDKKMYEGFKNKWDGKPAENSGKYWSFSGNNQASFSF